ncbi:MAG: hypothetical protein HYY63_02435, partial [Elusimicrobia bacterium]|nr:hypothetical protein [Elusimicrobiota bacterium]
MNRRQSLFLFAFLAIVILFLYMGVLDAPFLFDDFANIVYNPDIQDISQIQKKLIYRAGYGMGKNDPSRPVTFLSYALNYSFNNLNTLGYHAVNVFIHIFTAFFVFLISNALFRTLFPDKSRLAVLTALLFAVHPI